MRFIHEDANLKRLKTKQDGFNIHKTLGFLSICSFVYRYGFVYNLQGNLGFEGSFFDWVTMIIHLALSSTAIIFHVPKKRIHDKPMIIYEEYRLHAMIFTLRCFFVFVMATLFPQYGVMVPIGVGLHHYQADAITSKHGTVGNTAVRSLSERSTNIYKIFSLFYSLYQFLAIASHLTIHQRSADLGFNALIAIQSSAFLMTLYRKKIITGKTHMLIYSSCLILSSFHIIRLLDIYPVLLTVLAFLVRIKTSINKYLIWSGFLIMKMNS